MKIIFAGFLLLASVCAQAEFGLPDATPIVGATMDCQHPGGLLAINFKDKKVWISSKGDPLGIEFQNVQVSVFRCPNCYNITGDIFGGKADLKIRGNLEVVKATLTIGAPDAEGDGPDEVQTFPELTCTKRNK